MTFRRIPLLLVFLALIHAAPAAAQLITIRTVPVAQSDQFDFFPSQNLGMGGLSIALADTLLDPFRNPATASRTRSRIFASPAVYSVSSNAGNGRTLPLGAFIRSGQWFGAAAAAVQQVDAGQPAPFFGPIFTAGGDAGIPIGLPRGGVSNAADIDLGTGPASHGNVFAQAMLGRELPGELKVAGSLSWAGLRALDGVDLMYENAQRVDQSGHSFDARLGILKLLSGNRSLQAVVVHSRYAMAQDVLYLDNFWDPATQQILQRARPELNEDQTNTWGAHLQYAWPLSSGWQAGWVATANRMSHPKIPNYAIMNVPRDPGYSSAFNAGFGLAKRDREATFGAEFVLEPIWSHTWADAAAPIPTPGGGVIPTGGRTIENRFRFSNYLMRLGVGRDFEFGGAGRTLGIQLGLVVRGIRYHLTQTDHVNLTTRRQNESWTEWTPTWGLAFSFPEFEIRYRGAITNGGGRPGVANGCEFCRIQPPAMDVVVAPSAPLQMGAVSVTSHQFSLSLPIGRTHRPGGER